MIISQAPLDGAITRARYPDEHARFERLLEIIHYQLSVANVQRGNTSGASKADFPPVPEWANPDVERIGSKPLPLDEMAQWLGGAFLDRA